MIDLHSDAISLSKSAFKMPSATRTREQICETLNEAYSNLGVKITLSPADLTNPAGLEALSNQSIVYVDDAKMMLVRFIGELTIGTGGNAKAIHYKDQGATTEEKLAAVCNDIFASKPTVVLLDFNLSTAVTGDAIARKLLEKQPNLLLVGFSAEEANQKSFKDAGVMHCIVKGGAQGQELVQLSDICASHFDTRSLPKAA